MPNVPPWKRAESRLARLFGCLRRPLSGSNSRSGGSDDCDHPRLHLEAKYGKQCNPLWNLWRKAKDESGKRIPVLGLQEPRSHGFLLVIHSTDLLAVAEEFRKAQTSSPEDRTVETDQPVKTIPIRQSRKLL